MLCTCSLSKKKEEENKKIAKTVLDDEDPPFQDDPKDLNYQPQSQRYSQCQVLHLASCTDSEILSLLSLHPVVWKRKRTSVAMKMFLLEMT